MDQPIVLPRSATKPKNRPYYIDPKEFHNEIVKCQESKVITEKLGRMFFTLATKCSYMAEFHYDNPADRDDCIAQACQILCNSYYKPDVNAGTDLFSYFTQVSRNGLKQGWNNLKKNADKTYRIDLIFEESI